MSDNMVNGILFIIAGLGSIAVYIILDFDQSSNFITVTNAW